MFQIVYLQISWREQVEFDEMMMISTLYSNSGQFSYPLPNTVHPLDGSLRTGAGNCPEFALY